jgi:hypothetical protein
MAGCGMPKGAIRIRWSGVAPSSNLDDWAARVERLSGSKCGWMDRCPG